MDNSEENIIVAYISKALAIVGSITAPIYIFIILSVVFSRHLHGVSNIFICNLCIAELLMSINNIGLLPTANYTPLEFKVSGYGIMIGQIVVFLGSFCLNSVILSVDRYCKVSYPMHYIRLMTNRKGAAVIAASWIIAVSFGGVMVAATYSSLVDGNSTTIPSKKLVTHETYVLAMVVFSDIIAVPSIIVMTVLSTLLVRIARKHQRKIHDEQRLLAHIENLKLQQQNKRRPNPIHSNTDLIRTSKASQTNTIKDQGAMVSNEDRHQHQKRNEQQLCPDQQQSQQQYRQQHQEVGQPAKQQNKQQLQHPDREMELQQEMPQQNQQQVQVQQQQAQLQLQQRHEKGQHQNCKQLCAAPLGKRHFPKNSKSTCFFIVHFFTLTAAWLPAIIIINILYVTRATAINNLTYKLILTFSFVKFSVDFM